MEKVNPYAKLRDLLETRIARQRAALADSEAQLQGCLEAGAKWVAENQPDLFKNGKK